MPGCPRPGIIEVADECALDPWLAVDRAKSVTKNPIKAAHQVADRLDERGHSQEADHLRAVLLDSRAGSALLTGLREACQTVLTVVEAVDPVSGTLVEELRLEIDKRLKESPGLGADG